MAINIKKAGDIWSNFQKKGLPILLVSYGAVQVISLLQRILLARLLIEDDFARVSLLQEGISAFANLATLAVPLALVRFSLIHKEFKAYGWLSLKLIAFMNIALFCLYYVIRQFTVLLHDTTTQFILDYMILVAPAITLYIFADHFLTAQKLIREKARLLFSYRFLMFCLITGGVLLFNFRES